MDSGLQEHFNNSRDDTIRIGLDLAYAADYAYDTIQHSRVAVASAIPQLENYRTGRGRQKFSRKSDEQLYMEFAIDHFNQLCRAAGELIGRDTLVEYDDMRRT